MIIAAIQCNDSLKIGIQDRSKIWALLYEKKEEKNHILPGGQGKDQVYRDPRFNWDKISKITLAWIIQTYS